MLDFGPKGVFVTEDGAFWLADTNNKRIAIFQPDGSFLRELVGPGGESAARREFRVFTGQADRR